MAKLASRPCCPILSLKGNAVTLAKPSMLSRDTAEAKVTNLQEGEGDEEIAEVRQLAEQELGQAEDKKKRKRKAGGPNPLSCKKKKAKTSNESADSSTSSTNRKRQRKRNRPHSNRSGAACLGKHFQNIVDSVNKSSS
jgi:U3 small nucleolar RNA-associated protein 23